MHSVKWTAKSKLEKAGLRIVRLLVNADFQAFFVGGFVRDIFLRRTSDNIDIATDAFPEQVQKILDGANINYKLVGKAFGTILAIFDGQKIEITTFRREGRYSDQRHPDKVEFIADYLEDARRRDLTINAMYFDPIKGQLFDPTNGMKDLKAKLIRFVGDPRKRIDEDPLRMIRAVRLATTLGFRIEKNSFAAIKTRAKLIQDISGERLKMEMDKILESKNNVIGIKLLDEVGLLRFLAPEVSGLKNFSHKSKKYHLEGDVLTHSLLTLQNIKHGTIFAYAAFFHDSGKVYTAKPKLKDEGWVVSFHGHEDESIKIFQAFAKRFRFSSQDRDLVVDMIDLHRFWPRFAELTKDKQFELALRPNFEQAIELWKADQVSNKKLVEGKVIFSKPKSYLLARKILKLIEGKRKLLDELANGEFIMKITKIAPGIRVGELSDKIKIEILENKIKNLSDAENFLRKFSKNP